MTYACPAWELAADIYLLKLQHLQNKVLLTTEIFQGTTPVHDLHTAFNLPYVYHYITKLCSQQASVTQNREKVYLRYAGQGEARHRKYKSLTLGGGQAYDHSSD
jgi:hypothetical protein